MHTHHTRLGVSCIHTYTFCESRQLEHTSYGQLFWTDQGPHSSYSHATSMVNVYCTLHTIYTHGRKYWQSIKFGIFSENHQSLPNLIPCQFYPPYGIFCIQSTHVGSVLCKQYGFYPFRYFTYVFPPISSSDCVWTKQVWHKIQLDTELLSCWASCLCLVFFNDLSLSTNHFLQLSVHDL